MDFQLVTSYTPRGGSAAGDCRAGEWPRGWGDEPGAAERDRVGQEVYHGQRVFCLILWWTSDQPDGKKRPFDIAKPRTPQGEARVREKIMMEQMAALLAVAGEESFKKNLEIAFDIKPGSPQFDAALKAWREASSSQ